VEFFAAAAATPTVEQIGWAGFAWIAFSLTIFAYVGGRVFRTGGDAVDVSGYGWVELSVATMAAVVFGMFGYAQFVTPRAPAEKVEFTLTTLVVAGAMTLGFAGLVIVILRAWGRNIHQLFGLDRQPLWKAAIMAFVLLFAAFPIVGLGMLLTQQFSTGPDDLQDLVRFFRAPGDRAARIAVMVSAVVVAPMCEEMFFRGLIHGVVKRYGGLALAVVVNAGLFAFIHGNLPATGGLFALAVCLSLAYEFSGSLYVPIVMHACFNATQLVQMLFDPAAPKA
jgi:membrane protease YdiL (CAAX protease family)